MAVQFGAAARGRGVGVVGPVGPVEGREHGLQAVVVLLRDRVELVVVALGALDRQAEERVNKTAPITPPAR